MIHCKEEKKKQQYDSVVFDESFNCSQKVWQFVDGFFSDF